jgi:uncharacterized protein DUF4383
LRGPIQLYLGVLGAGLLSQGIVSLLLDASDRASNRLPERFANADPLHASIHVVWGVVILVLVLRGLSDLDASRLALVFGVFYSALAVVGLLVHHPVGMHLDRGENVFHLIVGPTALAIGLLGIRVQELRA